MQDRNQGGPPKVILAKTENEGAELEVFPNVGESLMIRRTMAILEKEKISIQSYY